MSGAAAASRELRAPPIERGPDPPSTVDLEGGACPHLAAGERFQRARFVIPIGIPSSLVDEVFRSEGEVIEIRSGPGEPTVRRAVGPHHADRMPGLDSGLRPAAI
jgi:hypothetical protein